MATLTSPGVSITVTDESQYVTAGTGTIPLLLLATQQDKTSPATGGTATGTTKANAGKLQSFASQRELINALGYPSFRTSGGSPLHGDERNEYGLQAAYSALGIGSQIYAIRADIDLNALTATSIRPKGEVSNNFLYLDLTTTDFGLFQWSAASQSYGKITPTVITSANDVQNDDLNTPKSSVGSIGSYAVVVRNANNPMFYKDHTNTWVPLGTMDWQEAWPTVESSQVDYTQATVNDGDYFSINGVQVTINATNSITAETVAEVVASINSTPGLTGITADTDPDTGLRLIIRANENAASGAGTVTIAEGSNNTAATLGLLQSGVSTKTYYAPMLQFGTYTQVPTFATGESTPAPSGSIWFKTGATGGGASWAIKKYNSSTSTWTTLSAPVYASRAAALAGIDALNGGASIADSSVFIQYGSLDVTTDTNGSNPYSPSAKTAYPATFRVFKRNGSGQTKVTGATSPSFTIGRTFNISVTQAGSATINEYSFTTNGTTADAFVALVLSKNIPNVFAQKESTGAVSLIHRSGGDIILTDTTGNQGVGSNQISEAGFSPDTSGIERIDSGANFGSLVASKWMSLTNLTYSTETPYVAPEDGALWYYGNATEADVMICGTDGWKGYRTVTNDARGYNLTNTDPAGPLFATTQPTLQSDGTALVSGDLWVDTSDLENFPVLYRYTGASWSLIDNTDKVSQNGVIFADARWDADLDGATSIGGIIDPVAGDLPSVTTMLLSNYIDLDCPDYRLYPRGTLLWNTRRNGMNVKQFVSDKFTAMAYPEAMDDGSNQIGTIPTYTSTWVNASGVQSDGTPYHGHKAQRQMVIKALRSAIDSNTDIREEQYNYNLIVCPGYPELIPNMVTLNKDRNETAFIIGDTPLDLTPSSTAVTTWSESSEVTGHVYLGVYYPHGLTNDINGNEIVVPASHMALRTYIYSDNISFPWFAPAGTRRGQIDNAVAIGYVNYTTGQFVRTGITQSQRDMLYINRVNPISLLPGAGITVYGNKTRSALAQSTDRVNVSRLVNFIRTTLTGISNAYLFEPNDKGTRDQIKNAIDSAMNDLVAKRGIYDYLVVCDTTNNTSDRIARNELYVDIAIEPMKDVEFIYIPIRLKNPGDIAAGGR